MKSIIQISAIFCLAMLTAISCTKDDVNIQDVENYTNETVYEMDREANCGRKGCFDFVWPIDIVFPDETGAEVGSYEELKEAVKAWKEANPDVDGRPQLGFPLDIMSREGDIYTLDSREDLKRVVKICIRAYWAHHDHRGHWANSCFKVKFPVNIKFPNGTVVEAVNRVELKVLLRAWKANNPNSDARPHLAFPINVELASGLEVIIDSREDLIALKEEYSGD